jgi:hypothetical protein
MTQRFWNVILALVMIAYCIYAGVFIAKSSFVIEGERYFTLFDDPMISMQYAKNFAAGEGLVWNAGGERVEGYSNLMWVIFMAGFHLLPLPLSKLSLLIQISGAIFLLLTLWFLHRIAREINPEAPWVGVLTVLLAGFYYPLVNWSLLGNEVSILAMLIAWVVWVAIKSHRESKTNPAMYGLIACATLVRIDAILPFFLVIVFLAIYDPENRKQHLGYGVLSLFLPVILQTGFRFFYYGEILPNTYYLKMTGVPLLYRVVRGGYVFIKFVWNLNWALFILPMIVVAIERRKATFLLMSIFLVMCLYSIYIGGDAWEHRGGANRFISTGIPLFFLLFAYALEWLREKIVRNLEPDGISNRLQWVSWILVLAVGLVSLINFNALLDAHSLRFLALRGQPLYVRGNERNTTIGLFIKHITQEDARVAVVAAGATPYYSERVSIDLLGKSDVRIAKGEMKNLDDIELIDFRPGHMKWDYAYSIGELQPDVVVEVWVGTNAQAAPFLEDYVVIQVEGLKDFLPDGKLYLRKDSSEILWDQVEEYLLES